MSPNGMLAAAISAVIGGLIWIAFFDWLLW